MSSARTLSLTCCAVVMSAVAGCPQNAVFPTDDATIEGSVLRWNKIAVDASGLDHAPVQPGESRTFGHQLGPTRSSRAMAIVHIAMFDAVNGAVGGFESYTRIAPATPGAAADAAVAQAAHDTLVAMFPSQAAAFDQALQDDLAAIPDGFAKQDGVALGARAAAAILALRVNDGAEMSEPYAISAEPGAWRPDPVNQRQQPLGEEWFRVKPFVMNSATQFRVPPPPALDSAEYASAFNEVKELGGDGIVTPTTRTDDQALIGIYWAYDGTPTLCAPPRLYNQIATQLAEERGVGGADVARLLALVNVSMADACIAIWESKYFYNFWRPVTGIREADAGTGPTGLGDSNPDTAGDATYLPLCAPTSNLIGKNFTPPFPAYPSGHAGFGGALFETLREFFGTDAIAFTFVSDELNGVTKDNEGNVRTLMPRSFTSLSQAEEETGQSRLYLGIHWRFDKAEGIAQGRRVADHVFRNAFQPAP